MSEYPYCRTAIPKRLLNAWKRYVNRETLYDCHESDNPNDVVLTVYGSHAETLLQQFLVANYPEGKIGCFSDPESSYVIDSSGDIVAFCDLS